MDAGLKLMFLALSELKLKKALPRIPQDNTKASYAPIPTLRDLEIDWNKPAAQILALVRAASPFFGATLNWKETFLKVWSARISRAKDTSVTPGTVSISKSLFEVAASDYFISLETLQLGTLRYASGQEFMAMSGIREGENPWKTL